MFSAVSWAPGASKLELSNLGDFVVLEVDGSKELVLGVHAKALEEVISGELRLALGGILIGKEQMFVQVQCERFRNFVLIWTIQDT